MSVGGQMGLAKLTEAIYRQGEPPADTSHALCQTGSKIQAVTN